MFVVNIKNTGVDGTIQVNEQLNLNQKIQIFNAILSAGEVRQVQAQGEPPKDFDWEHLATNTVGGPESKGDGDVIEVSS